MGELPYDSGFIGRKFKLEQAVELFRSHLLAGKYRETTQKEHLYDRIYALQHRL